MNVYTGGNATNTTLFTLPAEEYIEYAAVYHSGSGIKVFYINNSDCLCAWEDGFFTFLGYVEDASGLAVDGNGNYYYLTTTPTGKGLPRNFPPTNAVVIIWFRMYYFQACTPP